jgi:hypothetical protein
VRRCAMVVLLIRRVPVLGELFPKVRGNHVHYV